MFLPKQYKDQILKLLSGPILDGCVGVCLFLAGKVSSSSWFVLG